MPVNPLPHIIPVASPVCQLDVSAAFNTLTRREKKYAHCLARAAFEGSLAIFLQVSPESAPIFYVLYRLFKEESIESLHKKALNLDFDDYDWEALLVYTAAFYNNLGNYKGVGDAKIVPGCDVEQIRALLEVSNAGRDEKVMKAWKAVEGVISTLEERQLQLGFGEKGVTTYHSRNITPEDAQRIDRFLTQRNLESWNSRLFQEIGPDFKTHFTIKLASSEEGVVLEPVEFEGDVIKIVRGDYAPIMRRVQRWLRKALDFAGNKNQQEMLKKYIEHFKSGNVDEHKAATRFWIRDVAPSVETHIGFIENYRDPAGTRAEFEGFVAAVNKETSKKFQTLVSRAEEILKRLPWGRDYEKDVFLKPDFTALDVIAFGSSAIPSGIMLPNYDEIRQNEGFKNVSLTNVISAQPKQKMNFLDDQDEEMLFRLHKASFEVQVGLHELLGHGSGKLFQKNPDGTFNFDTDNVKDILTGGPIASWYEPGETWSTKFGALSNPYEECRAEAVGYVLCCDKDILEIFGYKGPLADDVKYVNWLNGFRAGLIALEFYQPDQQRWLHAQGYASYVLLKVVLEAGQGFVTIQETTGANGKPDLLFKMNPKMIDSVGRPAVTAFLAKLQAYRATGDYEGGRALFEEYGGVGEAELRWRSICLARVKPARLFVQGNTKEEDGEIYLTTYPSDLAGIIKSFINRFDPGAIEDLHECWEKDQVWF